MPNASKAALIKDFVNLSRYAGSRFDLVQASGGNSSVKLDGERMLVKASGVHLSEVYADEGYVTVRYPEILDILKNADFRLNSEKKVRETEAGRQVAAATEPPPASSARVSIEVFLHAALRRFVLHTHPLAVNMIACRKDWIECLTAIFPDALFVPYATPGIELGISLYARLEAREARMESIPQVIFLQNHGLIVNCEKMEEVWKLTEDVILKCESSCGVGLKRYRVITELVSYIGENLVAYLSNDRELGDLLMKVGNPSAQRPLFPDSFVFCGVAPLVLENLDSPIPLQNYRERFRNNPKVIIFEGRHYFIAKSIKKAKDIEEVYKANLLVLSSMKKELIFLSDDELAYLGNWEAEQYRTDK